MDKKEKILQEIKKQQDLLHRSHAIEMSAIEKLISLKIELLKAEREVSHAKI